MGQNSEQQRDRTWQSVASDKVIKEAVTQSLGVYINKHQGTVAEWVALRPILEVCDKETAYERGGRQREPWWCQTVAKNQLSAMLKEILVAARERCWKFGRHGEG